MALFPAFATGLTQVFTDLWVLKYIPLIGAQQTMESIFPVMIMANRLVN
jgi:hypothetical protein